jgi:hypothetical protein
MMLLNIKNNKLIKPKKLKKIIKKPNHEKKPIKPIRIFFKKIILVQFRFHKPEIKKTEPKRFS